MSTAKNHQILLLLLLPLPLLPSCSSSGHTFLLNLCLYLLVLRFLRFTKALIKESCSNTHSHTQQNMTHTHTRSLPLKHPLTFFRPKLKNRFLPLSAVLSLRTLASCSAAFNCSIVCVCVCARAQELLSENDDCTRDTSCGVMCMGVSAHVRVCLCLCVCVFARVRERRRWR